MVLPRRNIWILGGTGFIGRALLKHLLGNSANQIHMLINRNKPFGELEQVNTVSGSLSRFDPLWLKRYPPDVVFHLARPAGKNMYSRFWAAKHGQAANKRLINIFLSLPSPPIVIYVSGSLMYGDRPNELPALETSCLNPVSFAKTYLLSELPWVHAKEKKLLDIRFARPGWIAGPSSWFKLFFWDIMRQTGKIPCYGSGKQMMSLIHLDDGASAIDALSIFGKPGSDLNVYSDTITHKQFCEQLAALTGKQINMIPEKELLSTYGKTVAEALTSSIPMSSIYPDIHRKADIRFKSTETLLADIIRLLESKEGVLTE